jgi:hypothetical protein
MPFSDDVTSFPFAADTDGFPCPRTCPICIIPRYAKKGIKFLKKNPALSAIMVAKEVTA